MIQPGLERIGRLLKDVQLPWKAIHVAGTNGKGTICSYASALLTRRTIRNGLFTSPHLIDRWDCIQIMNKPVDEKSFREAERHFLKLNQQENINASEFEILTATAFKIFTDSDVDVGVVEVGMGGLLDATNILNNQAVSVISKIARDHQNFLGNTLEEIARHKAGILRPNVPYIVNPINEWNVQDVIESHANEIGAGPRILPETDELRDELYYSKEWREFATRLRPFQRENAALGYLAFVQVLKSLDLGVKKAKSFLPHVRNMSFPGRFQIHHVPAVFGISNEQTILVDGAHNPDAAKALDDYVSANVRFKQGTNCQPPPRRGYPITWVLAMTEGKDASQYLRPLLRPGDNVVTTMFGPVDGMPWVKPMDPDKLLKVAQEAQPDVTGLCVPVRGAFRALCAAKYLAEEGHPIVLSGSLYLVGDFLREKRQWMQSGGWDMDTCDLEERDRVNSFLSKNLHDIDNLPPPTTVKLANENMQSVEARRLEEEIEKLDREMKILEAEENRLQRTCSVGFETPTPTRKTQQRHSSSSTLEDAPMPSPKQKFFKDIEDIRKQLSQLPISTPTPDAELAPHSNDRNGLQDLAKRAAKPDDIQAILKQDANPRIRTHLARPSPDERRLNRLSRKQQAGS